MCGINGVLNFDISKAATKEQLALMNSKMIHRGPDDEGYHLDNNLGLSIRRLSVIDVQGGHQPISNEDNRYWVILNGEIYNYIELRKGLIAKGHIFKTKTDTEVLVHLYEDLQEGCVEKLNGMFAFAIWDSSKRELFVATDRIGIKPLFYFKNNSYFCFSSELKSILTMDFKKDIDRSSLFLYLFLLYVPYPRSIVKNIYKLEPASCIKISQNGDITKKIYWDLKKPAPFYENKIEEYKDKFKTLLNDSIQLQLRSDVPIGTFLSGGIDSSSVVAFISDHTTDNPMKTFSVGYEGHYMDERPFALEVAKKYNTMHTELYINKEALNKNLKRIIWYMDEPIGDSAAIPTFLLSDIASKAGVKVILNGTGGDEIFGGYNQYLKNEISHIAKNKLRILRMYTYLLKQKPHRLGHVYKSLNNPVFEYLTNINNGSYTGFFGFLKDMRWVDRLTIDIFCLFGDKYNSLVEDDFINGLMNFDLKTYLVGDLLFLLDKMTMGSSIEGRVPLLDHRLVEFMSEIPSSVKIRNGNLKSFVKNSLSGILPETILSRNKMGFGAPVLFWLLSGILDELHIFEDPAPVTAELFDCKKLKQIVRGKKFNMWNAQFIYNLAIFDLWAKEVFEK